MAATLLPVIELIDLLMLVLLIGLTRLLIVELAAFYLETLS